MITLGAGSIYHVKFACVASLNFDIYFLNACVMSSTIGEDGYINRLTDEAMSLVISGNSRLVTGIIDFSFVPDIE
jgi:hypothetical protein